MTDTADPPRRFRLSRIKGSKLPDTAKNVARPTKWGNRWKAEVVDGVGWCCADTKTGLIVQARDRADAHDLAVSHFRAAMTPEMRDAARRELRGRDLACWCSHDMPCHADVWLEIANG